METNKLIDNRSISGLISDHPVEIQEAMKRGIEVIINNKKSKWIIINQSNGMTNLDSGALTMIEGVQLIVYANTLCLDIISGKDKCNG